MVNCLRSIVIKPDGIQQTYDPLKLLEFLHTLTFGLDSRYLEIQEVVNSVSLAVPDTIALYLLYEYVAELIASRVINHPDHSILAGRLEACKLQKMVNFDFVDNITRLYNNVNNDTGSHKPLVSKDLYQTVIKHKEVLSQCIRPERDLELTYFGIKTLEKSYLIKINDIISETPQFLFLRVSLGIHGDDIDKALQTYELMSSKYFIHASPTLFNAGTDYTYLSSCFLLAMESDSIDGIYKTLHKSALISKASGGIGIHVHNIRADGSNIAYSSGKSSGLVPMLKVFNETARYVDQGGNRPGAFAIYIEPWHADVFKIIDLRKNYGKEELRARDLFCGLWIPDLFMQKVKSNEYWCLFSPDLCSGLSDCYGEEFNKLYFKYETEKKYVKKIKAQELWASILESQVETGGPYILFKDACNRKSNQNNLGVIKSSNLCCEIVEYSSPTETAVCNLGSLALQTFIVENNDVRVFDFVKLHSVTKVLAKNLNKIIDVTKYPIESAKVSNLKHRPIAVGVQGLADTFAQLRFPFESKEARELNIQIFETIYHASIEASIELAREEGPYESFEGSPASKGLFQFDLWNHKPSDLYDDWNSLRRDMQQVGLRNSLLVAPMPTASTSQILGSNECFEPFTSNVYTRRVIAGEFQVVNQYLVKDLIDLNLWNKSMKNKIIVGDGSIQNIEGIPQTIKDLYKTVWEIPQKCIVNMAADRGKFIDQLQSMNIYMRNPTFAKLTSCHFYAWEKGLKTGMYYLRTQAASKAIQFTADQADFGTPVIMTPPNETTDEIKRKPSELLEGNVSVMKRKRILTPESQARSPDIYDNTIRACNIQEKGECESCLG